MPYRLCFLALVLASPLVAQNPAPAPVVELTLSEREALIQSSKLHVARNEVVVSWELPPDAAVKGIDIYRNTQSATKGRGRLDYVRPAPALFIDKVPDASVTYWYWLKIALSSGAHYNIGPVKTPDAAVWTP